MVTPAEPVLKTKMEDMGSLRGPRKPAAPKQMRTAEIIKQSAEKELGGISGLASGTAKELGVSSRDAGTIGSAASQLASYALPSVSGGSAPSYTPPVQPGLSLQGPATQAPSPTVGQSLSIAPSLGYSPTGSVFGSSDAEGKKSNVWNVGSLRNIGSAEA